MIADVASPIFQWLNAHPELAGLATFIISAGESVAILGTIVPGSVMMTVIGALVGAGIIPLWSTLIWAILGATVGDGISYWLGFHFKDRIHLAWPFHKHPQILIKGESFVRRYGGMSVFFGRFVGPVRALVPLVAGMLGMKPLRFFIANFTSAVGWAPAYMLPGILLGAASLEVPSEIGARVILILLFSILLMALAIWILKKTFGIISQRFNQFLGGIWQWLLKSRHLNFLTVLLRHYDTKKLNGQLGWGILLIIVALLFLYLSYYATYTAPHSFLLNNVIFHIFRSIRTNSMDSVMLFITLLGDKRVILPLVITLFLWFSIKKNWHSAWHILALGFLTIGSIEGFKYLVHSPRPWGFIDHGKDNYSFPSGHAALAFTFYLGIVLFFNKALHIKRTRLIYFLTGALISAVAISRLYFGVHWLTDIIGGCLLGTFLIVLIMISYNRKKENTIHLRSIGWTIILTLLLSYSVVVYFSFNTVKPKYAMVEWPAYTINLESWWEQKTTQVPLFRVNRYGIKSTIFNVQWVGDIDKIKDVLLQNNWSVPPSQDWLTIFYRLSSVQSSQHLPLISPLYLDKPPVLVLIKYVLINKLDKKLMIIRLWNSHLYFNNIAEPLWLGTVEYAPSTYSWLFKNFNNNEVSITVPVLFKTIPSQYAIKKIKFRINSRPQDVEKDIILLKQKKFYYS